MKPALVRLASSLPKGSEDRKTLLHMARGMSHPEQFQKANKLDQVDPMVAKIMVESGLADGDSSDDKISVSKGAWPAASLKPSQTSMVLGKALGMALFMLKTGKVGGDLGAVISQDGFIMDGHHRWAATILASGSKGKVGGYGAKLPGKDLLRVMNLLTKGKFNVRGGKSGSGALSDFTPANVAKMLQVFVEQGVPGKFPWKPEDVRAVLEQNFGSVENGINQMAKNSSLMTLSAPSWAPPRKQMPVVEPENVPTAVKLMNRGEVDWNDPYTKQALTRLASALPKGSEDRKVILRRLASSKKANNSRYLLDEAGVSRSIEWDHEPNADFWQLLDGSEVLGAVGDTGSGYVAYEGEEDWPIGRSHRRLDDAMWELLIHLGLT